MHRLACAIALLFIAAACTSTGSTSPTPATTRSTPFACELIETGRVEEFVGEPVHEPGPSKVAPAVGDTTCLWGDADPDDPGHLLSLTLTPRGEVGEPEPGEGDTVYEVSALGDGAFAAQGADGEIRVVFAVDDQWVDLGYHVLPSRYMEEGAIDRLIRVAEEVRAQLSTRQ